MTINIFSIAIGVGLAVLGHSVAFWRLKWKAGEARRTDWEKLRRPINAEALALVYGVENSRGNADDLEAALGRIRDWFPAKASYLPPKGNDAIFDVITDGALYHIDLHNRETGSVSRSREIFNRSLQLAKLYFMNNEDIRWLPEDLKPKK